jgi:hypothetical protein
MHDDKINSVKIQVDLPKEILQKLVKIGYLNEYISISGNLTIRTCTTNNAFNKTVADLIVKEWS